MSEDHVGADLRSRIRWVDGHADVWAVFADADVFARCVDALVAPYVDDSITHVVGIESRGFVLGGAAALALGAGFVAVRKNSGHFPGELLTGDGVTDYKGDPVHLRLQRDRLDDGGRVLVVDDWFETGAQFAVARRLIEKTGARVVGASVLIDQTPQTLHPSLGKYRYLVVLPPRLRPHHGR